MYRLASDGKLSISRSASISAGVGSLALLGIIAYLDYRTYWALSFALLYLIPITIAMWFGGRGVGVVVLLCAMAGCFAVSFDTYPSLHAAIWNFGGSVGIFLIVALLLDQLRQHRTELPLLRSRHPVAALTAGSICVLGAVALLAHARSTPRENSGNVALLPPNYLKEFAAEVPATMHTSRPVLLGSRNPTGPSCVTVVRTGQVKDTVPINPGDLDGGPGTSLATLYYFDRQQIKTPMQDFNWHQTRLKTYLENELTSNTESGQFAIALSEKAQKFSEMAQTWESIPPEVTATGFSDSSDWPSYCLSALDRAVAAKDLEAVKHWSGEFASATFSLADLHRWLGFLCENHLTALEFQKQCETLFSSAESMALPYDTQSTTSHFPAGVLSLHGIGNYYEVEHQAERLFSMPTDRLDELALNKHYTPGSAWVTPGVRETFLEYEGALSAENKKTWEAAARTPYEHSFIINMLYRAGQLGDMAEEERAALVKFDATHPHASEQELVGNLMYRGHSFAGLEWSDRFQPQLVEAAGKLTGTDAEIFLAACRWTYDFYKSHNDYAVTFTLRDAIEKGKLDCVRATDMIGAIYRNAGGPRFAHVRWCAENAGHSVAAVSQRGEDGKTHFVLGDGLTPTKQLESWPDAYFHGHAWPEGMQKNSPPYCAELYVRGIDNYIWAEGYIIRGPNAGTMTRARIPYSTTHLETTTTKVFEGPYPQ
jgi:hypothetical protein